MSLECNYCVAETKEKLGAAEKRIKELEERERRCPTMLEAEARALVRALQEIIAILGMDADASPAQIVAYIAAMVKADHLLAATKKVDPNDPWLGVWRAKDDITLDFGAPYPILKGREVEVSELIPWESVRIVYDESHKIIHSVEFLKANFEKVTEEGEGCRAEKGNYKIKGDQRSKEQTKFDPKMDEILLENDFAYYSDWEYGPISGWNERFDHVSLKLMHCYFGYLIIFRRHAGGENKEQNIGLSNSAEDIIQLRDLLKKLRF